MAYLDRIRQTEFDIRLDERGLVTYAEKPIGHENLPQLFWANHSGWDEANRWFYERHVNADAKIETVDRQAKYLAYYAKFLEKIKRDWRHFPSTRKEQVLRRFRKHLIDCMNSGDLACSTAQNCMAVAIQFYRYAVLNNFLRPHSPMWQDKHVLVPYFDTAGFKRSLLRRTTDLSIRHRHAVGRRLEEGLLPISDVHMNSLLEFTAREETIELHLMLSVGFLTGARVSTVATLTKSSVATARPDPLTPGIFLLHVGPGTRIKTKFDVKGDIMLPKALLDDLATYSRSNRRLYREAKASKVDKDLLFLTQQGEAYSSDSIGRLVRAMRRKAVDAGLQFMAKFYFHQSRATFGTSLMQILLDCKVSASESIRTVRDAMLHKDEKTTWGYIHFLQSTNGKQKVAARFNEAFTGVRHRDWSKYRDE